MKKPAIALAVLPLLLLTAVPAARAEHRDPLERKLRRLAHDVAHGARDVYRAAAGRHGRHRVWGPPRGYRHHAPHQGYTLRLLADLEHRARDFERALEHHPVPYARREFEALSRSFDRAAESLFRGRPSPALARDFEHLAEHMYALDAHYREALYPRRARYRPYDGRYDRRVEIYGPRWQVEWRRRGGLGHDHDWDSDSDSDSY